MALEITIDQTEIETAIKNHIGTLLTINEGQEVAIDLKAGRGENGFSASVKIGTVTAGVAPSTEQAEKPVVTGPFKRAVKAQAAPTETAQTTAQAASKDDTADDTTTDAGEQQADAQPAEQAGEAEATPKAGGLFGHLGKRTGTEAKSE